MKGRSALADFSRYLERNDLPPFQPERIAEEHAESYTELLEKVLNHHPHLFQLQNVRFEIGGKTVYTTDPFTVGGRLYAAILVSNEFRTTLQFIYQSHSHACWRIAPFVFPDLTFFKPEHEHFVDVPALVNHVLDQSARESGEGITVEEFLPRAGRYAEYATRLRKTLLAIKVVVNYEDTTFRDLHAPDLSATRLASSSPSELYGDIERITLQSKNGEIAYIFIKTGSGFFLGSIESLQADLLPIGVRAEGIILPKSVLTPLWEYRSDAIGKKLPYEEKQKGDYIKIHGLERIIRDFFGFPLKL